jgi:hypothetical protein
MIERGQNVCINNTLVRNMHSSYFSTGQFKNKAGKEQAPSLIACLISIGSLSFAMQSALA